MKQIILDTETTGLSVSQNHRIVEIGAIELLERQQTGRHFHQYINPQREVEKGALSVHGITNEFLEQKPIFSEIVEEFLAFISGAELIIHNAPFDTAFLNYELKLASNGQNKWDVLSNYCSITDSLSIARRMHPGQRNSLDALCKRYGVDASGRDLHGALLDSELLCEVYLRLTGGQMGIQFNQAISNPALQNWLPVESANTLSPPPHYKVNEETKQAHNTMLANIMDEINKDLIKQQGNQKKNNEKSQATLIELKKTMWHQTIDTPQPQASGEKKGMVEE